MLGFGYVGEVGILDPQIAFWPSMAAWGFIIWEIFKGEASKINAGLANPNVQKAYKTMTLLVTVGWAIYPLGYFIGYFTAGADAGVMNLIYNIADFWNKIAFGLVIWAAAVADSESKTS
jgi:bacteriorhodopsin